MLQNFDKARGYFKQAATTGLPEAQFNYASLLLEGKVTKMDPQEANTWLFRAAQQNHLASQVMLARNYQKGVGHKKDDKQAFDWFNKAAGYGNPIGMYETGLAYKEGVVVEKDLVQAHVYLNLALASGYQRSCQSYVNFLI